MGVPARAPRALQHLHRRHRHHSRSLRHHDRRRLHRLHSQRLCVAPNARLTILSPPLLARRVVRLSTTRARRARCASRRAPPSAPHAARFSARERVLRRNLVRGSHRGTHRNRRSHRRSHRNRPSRRQLCSVSRRRHVCVLRTWASAGCATRPRRPRHIVACSTFAPSRAKPSSTTPSRQQLALCFLTAAAGGAAAHPTSTAQAPSGSSRGYVPSTSPSLTRATPLPRLQWTLVLV